MSNDYTIFENCLLEYLNIKRLPSCRGHIKRPGNGDLAVHIKQLQCSDEKIRQLPFISQNWPFQIISVSIQTPYVALYLNRSIAIEKTMSLMFKNNSSYIYGSSDIFKNKKLIIIGDEVSDEMSAARISLMKQVITNFAVFTGFDICSLGVRKDNCFKIYLTHKSNTTVPNGYKLLNCCIVTNMKTKCRDHLMTYSQYENLKEMEIRAIDENMDKDMRTLLIKSTIVFELLSVKHDKAVSLNFSDPDSRELNSPAAFILYNLTRLDAILQQFEQKVCSQEYPPLPIYTEVNFELLSSEKEWDLVINFILRFPAVVLSSIENIADGKVGFHNMCSFLLSFSRAISSYYQSTKILMGPVSHMLPLVFARIYLVRALRDVLLTGLKLINVK